jgi:cytochrome c5
MKIMMVSAFVLCLGTLFAFAGDSQELVEKTCSSCHDLGRVRAAYEVKDQAAWSATVARMLAKGNAPAVTHEEHGLIVDWLAEQKNSQKRFRLGNF